MFSTDPVMGGQCRSSDDETGMDGGCDKRTVEAFELFCLASSFRLFFSSSCLLLLYERMFRFKPELSVIGGL